MLDGLIEKYEDWAVRWRSEDVVIAHFFEIFVRELKDLKELQEKEKKRVFTPEQEKEIRKYIKEHIDVETTEVVSYGGCEVSTGIRVRNNQRGFY